MRFDAFTCCLLTTQIHAISAPFASESERPRDCLRSSFSGLDAIPASACRIARAVLKSSAPLRNHSRLPLGDAFWHVPTLGESMSRPLYASPSPPQPVVCAGCWSGNGPSGARPGHLVIPAKFSCPKFCLERLFFKVAPLLYQRRTSRAVVS